MAKKTNEKWIVTKSICLGFIKQTVNVGAIIEYDQKGQKLIIDGVEYSQTKDLDIMKKHGFVEPYKVAKKKEMDKVLEEELKKKEEEKKLFDKQKNKQDLPVVQSDEDMQTTIDISHTVKQKPVARDKNAELEVVKSDESLEERVARKQATIPKMPVVQDDTYGDVDSKSMALNADKKVAKSKEEYNKIKEENAKRAKETEEKLAKEWVEKAKPKEFTDVEEIIETESKDTSEIDKQPEKEIDATELLPKDVTNNDIPDQDTIAYPPKRKKAKKAVVNQEG